MEDENKLVVSPKMTQRTRDKINILTRELKFKRASDTTDFLYELFERLTVGQEFESKEGVLAFLETLRRDKTELAEENKKLTIWKIMVKEELENIIKS